LRIVPERWARKPSRRLGALHGGISIAVRENALELRDGRWAGARERADGEYPGGSRSPESGSCRAEQAVGDEPRRLLESAERIKCFAQRCAPVHGRGGRKERDRRGIGESLASGRHVAEGECGMCGARCGTREPRHQRSFGFLRRAPAKTARDGERRIERAREAGRQRCRPSRECADDIGAVHSVDATHMAEAVGSPRHDLAVFVGQRFQQHGDGARRAQPGEGPRGQTPDDGIGIGNIFVIDARYDAAVFDVEQSRCAARGVSRGRGSGACFAVRSRCSPAGRDRDDHSQ
jgi:hypothetical protein